MPVILVGTVLTTLWKFGVQDFIMHRLDYNVARKPVLLLRMHHEQAESLATYSHCHMGVSLYRNRIRMITTGRSQ
jgi:hypothetical protein